MPATRRSQRLTVAAATPAPTATVEPKKPAAKVTAKKAPPKKAAPKEKSLTSRLMTKWSKMKFVPVILLGSFVLFTLTFSEKKSPASLREAKRIENENAATACNIAPNNAPWDPLLRVFPLSFGLPEGRFGRLKKWKTLRRKRDFAHIIPGIDSTYIYKTEQEYYDGYAEAWFGITMEKAGWDCFRHYEIIASGSMPYFLNYARVPENVMHNFPMSIVRQSMELPGVPTQEEVKQHMARGSTENLKIDYDVFNVTEYYRLLDELAVYAVEELTWKRIAQYLLNQIHNLYPCMEDPRILMITTQTCEYQSCVVFGGLYALLGSEKMSSYFGPKKELFQQFAKEQMYGNGFSYSNVFDNEWNVTKMDELMKQRLKNGFFNMIVFTNAGNEFCDMGEYFLHQQTEARLLLEYQEKYNPLVVTVDGNDIDACHKFYDSSNKNFTYHVQFVREYQAKGITCLREWTGCRD